MKKLLIPSLLFAACAVEHGDMQEDQQADSTEDGTQPPEEQENQATLLASFYYEPRDCSDHSVYLTPILFYSDGSSTDNVVCQYELADGSVVDGCSATPSVPSLQNIVMTAYDPVTGATARAEMLVEGPKTLGAVLDVSSDGLMISWQADAPYDGVPGIGSVALIFDPADKVVISDPAILQQPQGSVQVTEAGTYTILLTTRIGFGQGFGCSSQVQKTVEVACHEGHQDSAGH